MNSLIWWFVQNTLTVLLIIPCVLLACRVFRDRPAVQHLLWLVLLLKLMTPPIVAWPWAADHWRVLPASQDLSIQVVTVEPVPVNPHSEALISETSPMDSSLSSSEFVAKPRPMEQTTSAPVLADTAPTTRLPWTWLVPVMILSMWLTGAIASFKVQLRRWTRFARVVRSGVPAPSHLRKEVAGVATRLQIKPPVCVVVKGTESPFLWCAGAIRLVWPESIASPDDASLCRGVIAHELAHLRRRDHWTTWLELAASIVWWWNPLFWFVRWRMREAAEMSCDAIAIAADPENRHSYAERLLQLSTQSKDVRSAAVLAVGSVTVASFERRLKMILSPTTSGKLSCKGGLLIVLLAVVALPYWSLAQTPKPDDPKATRAAPAETNEKRTTTDRDEDGDKSAVHYEGTVLGPDGKPLPGANVHIISRWDEATKLGPVRATSDANGRFSFDAVDMTWQQLGTTKRRGGLIVATKSGFVPEWMETWGNSRSIGAFRNGLWGPHRDTPIELQLAQEGVPIRGQLLGNDGKPLAGIQVRLTGVMIPRKRDLTAFLDHWSKAPTSATFLTGINYKRGLNSHFELLNIKPNHVTDAEGRFELSGVGRDRIAQMELKSPTIITSRIQVMTRDSKNVGILLDREGKPTRTLYGANFAFTPQQGFTVSGVVRDRQTQKPIANMWVKHRGYNPLTAPEKAKDMAVTDSSGRFAISGLDPKLLDYEAKHRGVDAVPQPGTQFLAASGTIEKDGELVIETERGINYRIRIVDKTGEPVDATVEYHMIKPNDISSGLARRSVNHAAKRADGTYEGFVLPGPGAILVKARRGRFRPTFVDPRAFFAPGKTWPDNSSNVYNTYGSFNALAGYGTWYDQRSYAAVVLINPAKDAKPLQLTATLTRDQPRMVSLVDLAGEPVTNARASLHQWAGARASKMEVSGATFPVYGLATNYDQEITFTHEERRLVGHLTVPANDNSALSVTMQPWATIKGRFVDAGGKPLVLKKRGRGLSVTNDSVKGTRNFLQTIDKGAHFRVERMVPGHQYSFRGVYLKTRELTPVDVFKKLALKPGEIRDFGDIVVPTRTE